MVRSNYEFLKKPLIIWCSVSMFYAYVLKNKKGLLYKGSTNNLEKRLQQHNSDDFPGYTQKSRPWKLAYSESFRTRREAEAREKFFKSGKGRELLKKIIG